MTTKFSCRENLAFSVLRKVCLLFKNWKINTLSSKSMQTEKAKSSHFDRTRGFKNQIFPTKISAHLENFYCLEPMLLIELTLIETCFCSWLYSTNIRIEKPATFIKQVPSEKRTTSNCTTVKVRKTS